MSPRLTVKAEEGRIIELVDEGTYECTVLDASELTQGPKAQYIPVEFVISEGQPFAGQHLWRNCPIEGKGSGIFVDLWNKVMDDELTVGEEGANYDVDSEEMHGQKVICIVRHEDYEGTTRAKVTGFLAP